MSIGTKTEKELVLKRLDSLAWFANTVRAIGHCA